MFRFRSIKKNCLASFSRFLKPRPSSICLSFSKPCLVVGGGGTGGLVAHFMAGWLESQQGGATASGSLPLPVQAPELRATATKGGPHPESACSAL